MPPRMPRLKRLGAERLLRNDIDEVQRTSKVHCTCSILRWMKKVGGRGISGIRAVLGGFFIALDALPLILNKPTAYKMLGFAYLTVAVVRMISILSDRSVVTSNWISIAFEVVVGVIS